MKPFVLNSAGRIVFPSNFFPSLDFAVFDSPDQLNAVIHRDFDAKAPTGTDLRERAESGAYHGRYELLGDLALNLLWVDRYAITMYERRPTRWRDVARRRDDVFLPALTPWDAETEDRIFGILFDVFRTRLRSRSRRGLRDTAIRSGRSRGRAGPRPRTAGQSSARSRIVRGRRPGVRALSRPPASHRRDQRLRRAFIPGHLAGQHQRRGSHAVRVSHA